MNKGTGRAEPRQSALIGITGTYCAGKNHVAALLENRGFLILDVDRLGRRIIEDEKDAIVARFGSRVLDSRGAVDRKILGDLVFGNKGELTALENIVHPGANRLTEEWIQSNRGRPLAVNAALLHRSTVFHSLDCIILVRAPLFIRLFRALRRDHLSLVSILKRISSQKHFEAQYFQTKADTYTVNNRGYFRCRAHHSDAALARRIDTILALEGMVR